MGEGLVGVQSIRRRDKVLVIVDERICADALSVYSNSNRCSGEIVVERLLVLRCFCATARKCFLGESFFGRHLRLNNRPFSLPFFPIVV